MRNFRTIRAALLSLAIGTMACVAARADDKVDQSSPTLVTVHRKNAPAAEVLAEIAKQAGMTIDAPNVAGKTLTIDADAKPFWAVLLDAGRQVDCVPQLPTVDHDGDRSTARLTLSGQDSRSPTFTAGPALATFTRIERSAKLITPGVRRDTARIGVQLAWEPGLNVIFYEPLQVPDEAVDESGRSLVRSSDADAGSIHQKYIATASDGPQQQFGSDLTISLEVPPDAGRRIARLRGKVRAFTGRPATVDVANLKGIKDNTPIELGRGNVLSLHGPTLSNQMFSMQVAIDRKAGESEESWQRRRMLLLAGTCVVKDASGNNWSRTEHYNGSGMSNNVALFAFFSASRQPGVTAAPATLTFNGYDDALAVEVAYDLKDLPLP